MKKIGNLLLSAMMACSIIQVATIMAKSNNAIPTIMKEYTEQGNFKKSEANKQYTTKNTSALKAKKVSSGIKSLAQSITNIEISDSLKEDSAKGYTVEKKTAENKTVNILKINKEGTYKITQASSLKELWSVEVATSKRVVNLTLSNVNLDVSSVSKTAAFIITGDCETIINLDGVNTLKSADGCAGLQNNEHPITIKGEGTLNANGGVNGAGIGGGENGNGSNIAIESGTINANGGLHGAGIGGGKNRDYQSNGNGTNITINGGTITANGGQAASGIGGGGNWGCGKYITITGGTVYANGVEGAGIGGGQCGDGSYITISGGTVNVFSIEGAGIGGGQQGDGHDIKITGKDTNVTIKLRLQWGWNKNGSAFIGAGSGDVNNPGYLPGSSWNIQIDDDVNINYRLGESGTDNANDRDATAEEIVIGNSLNGGVRFSLIDKNGQESTHFSKESDLANKIGEGSTVKLLSDAILGINESITISEGKNLTLDLNGFSISQEKTQTTGYSLLTNNGELVIKDSSKAKTGKISYTDTGNGGEYVSNTITNNGKLVVESGTIENKSSTTVAKNGYPYAIDNHSGSRETSLTINGGTVDCNSYAAIRLFCNSTTNKNSATINEGAIIKGCIEYQQGLGENDKALGSLTINGGEFKRNNANMLRSLYVFSFLKNRDSSAMELSINGGTFEGLVEVNEFAKDFNKSFITGGTYKNGQYVVEYVVDSGSNIKQETKTFDNNPSQYTKENGTNYIVRRDGNSLEDYSYTVLKKSNLTSGVYLTDPTGALAEDYYVSNKDNGVWTVSRCGKPIIYTVTYTDGVDNEVIFEDQAYGDLLPGAYTPEFSGTPTRKGYAFAGWSPSLSKIVTGDTTYTATWKVDSNNNGKADDEEEKYTVTYTDGVSDEEVFKDEVYKDLLSGTKTPEFTGTTVREGYVFGGWSTGVSETVTGNVTYTATWKVDSNNNGKADDEEEKYTVTYTDGVSDEEVFKDEVYKDLLSGTKTPEFTGTAVREGYVFGGWSTAVSETVTGNVTYTATWKVDSNNNGLADDEEEKYTVTYTDGVSDEEVFKDQVYKDLLSGTKTPGFNGTPTREGYTFTGWTPKVSDTVTGNVVYEATWKLNEKEEPTISDNNNSNSNLILWASVGGLVVLGGGAAIGVAIAKKKKKNK